MESENKVSVLSDKAIELIKNVLKKQGLENKDFRAEPVGKVGDNFASQVKRIIVENTEKSFNMILKILPYSTENIINEDGPFDMKLLFKNEILMYDLLSKYEEYQKNAGVVESDEFKFPKCYASVGEENIILLEDMTVSDFTMLDKFEPLSDECVRIILKKFAMFHCLSYVMKHQEPVNYNDFISKLSNPINNKPDFISQFQSTLEMMENEAILLVEQDKYKNVLQGSMKQMLPMMQEMDDEANVSKYSVINQGVCWTNNVLFKMKEGKPVACILIDYQLPKISSPANDLLHMILNCTDYSTRNIHFLEWIDYYYSELNRFLDYFKLKSDIIYPKHELDIDLKRHSKVMLGFSIFSNMMVMRKPEEAVKLKEAMESQDSNKFAEAMKTSELENDTLMATKTKIEGLIDTLLEFKLV
ncbi:uncharacterized protein ACR2FA_007043 [Aphomia sociella]